MNHHIHSLLTHIGAAFLLAVAVFATACSKKEPPQEASPETASEVVAAPNRTADGKVIASTTPIASAPKESDSEEAKEPDPLADLGKIVAENQSYLRRSAMAKEALVAREKILQEENETIKSAAAEIQRLKTLLAAAEKTLQEAYEADPDWAAAKAKADTISKEAEASKAKTIISIHEARKRGIKLQPHHLKPPAQEGTSTSQTTENP